MPGNANSGRRKQSATVLQMKGRRKGVDSGGRPVPEVPKFRRVAPEPPEWMTEDARREWDRVVPGLTVLDILKAEDRAMLVAYCETWSTFKQLTLDVYDEGVSIEVSTSTRGPNGTSTTRKSVVNPKLAARDRAGRELRGFAAQFGLSPSSETALGRADGADGGDENPFE